MRLKGANLTCYILQASCIVVDLVVCAIANLCRFLCCLFTQKFLKWVLYALNLDMSTVAMGVSKTENRMVVSECTLCKYICFGKQS